MSNIHPEIAPVSGPDGTQILLAKLRVAREALGDTIPTLAELATDPNEVMLHSADIGELARMKVEIERNRGMVKTIGSVLPSEKPGNGITGRTPEEAKIIQSKTVFLSWKQSHSTHMFLVGQRPSGKKTTDLLLMMPQEFNPNKPSSTSRESFLTRATIPTKAVADMNELLDLYLTNGFNRDQLNTMHTPSGYSLGRPSIPRIQISDSSYYGSRRYNKGTIASKGIRTANADTTSEYDGFAGGLIIGEAPDTVYTTESLRSFGFFDRVAEIAQSFGVSEEIEDFLT